MNSRIKLNKVRTSRAKRSGLRMRASGAPRLVVFRSNRGILAQLIDDNAGKTLAAVNVKELGKGAGKKTKSEQAGMLGELMAKKAIEAGVKKAVFDRREYAYHGRVRAFAEGARKGGLTI